MKKKLIAVILSAVCLAAAIPQTFVFADGEKVVTLGADLSEEQKQAILRYFGVQGQNYQTLTITNQDERDHLGSYVPLEQIGTHTYSCAYVNPTTSGGIQVKTANLSWVTSNMIATTLSTSGVVNCEVLAAAPFEVSGTGALTGILMAYETASGTELDETKKELATQELITTTNVANSIGQQEATNIVNESKIQVIQGNVINENEIQTIIEDVAEEQNISLSDEDRQLIVDLMEQIAQQDYDYEEMKDTLERVEANVQEMADQQSQNTEIEGAQEIDSSADVVVDVDVNNVITADSGETETPETLAEDSILMNTDDSALGDAVVIDATNQSALTEETSPETSDAAMEESPVVSEENIFDEQPETAAQTEIPGAEEIVDQQSQDAEIEEGKDLTIDVDADNVIPSDVEETELPADSNTEAEDGSSVNGDNIIPLYNFYFAPYTADGNNYEVQPAGLNELQISFMDTTMIAGSGTVTVYNAADSTMYDTIAMSDTSRVSVEMLSDRELTELGWTEGAKAVIRLNQPLAQDSAYYVELTEDVLMTSDGSAHSEATLDNQTWMIQTAGNGFTIEKDNASFDAGSTLTGHMIMDTANGIPYAAISGVDTSLVGFSQYEFNESADFTVDLYQAGTTTFQITYYDAEGNVADSFEYTITVE